MTLFIVPQLPVKGRYQEHWIFWWVDELKRLGVDYYIVRPDKWYNYIDMTKYFISNPDEYFAPVPESIHWDAEIAIKLSNMLQFRSYDDYILFLDFDYTGMFQGLIPLIKRYNLELRMGAYVHAGSWAPNDYFAHVKVKYGKKFIELGTSEILDNLFFPSESALVDAVHRMCAVHGLCTELVTIFDCIDELKLKSYVVGSLWKPYKEIIEAKKKKEELISKEKWLRESKIVMINGRYESLDHKLLSQIIEKLRGKATIVATDKRVARRYEIKHVNYFEALGVAKVMLQPKVYDTFGLAVVEALYTLTSPVLPKLRVYEELYPKYAVKSNVTEIWVEMIEYILDNYDKMIEEMKLDYELIKKHKLNAPENVCKILRLI